MYWLTCSATSFSDCISESGIGCHSKRRTCLPAPCPNTSNISLWNILRNNIGKDLSKVAMPVELNEPLNTLQRLCEELEYSELLDKAAHTPNPFERMVNTLFLILHNIQYSQNRIQCINNLPKKWRYSVPFFFFSKLREANPLSVPGHAYIPSTFDSSA